MSKIDVSENTVEPISCAGNGSFMVLFNGKYYGYFTTRAGALAYLEALKHGEGFINGSETEALSELHGMLQGSGSEGGNKS